jgi:ribokinase
MLVILGSVNADLLFKVQKLPAPGETVLCPGYAMAPGGKGSNQAAAAAKAGADTRFIGHLGSDAYGPVVRKLLVDAGIDCERLADSEKPTAIAVIGVDEAGENAIIVASGANLDTASDQVPDDLLGPATTVLCQNEIRMAETAAILARGKAAGSRTILNLAPAGPLTAEVLDTLDVLVVNEIEARMAAGSATGEPLDLAKRLAQTHQLTCVVTLGAAGAVAVGPDGGWRVGSLSIEPVDTTGAGDAFVGVLAAALDAKKPMAEALHRASLAAGLTCLAMGAQSSQPKAAEIDARLAELAVPVPLD